jgi:hypothetical protein
LKKCFDGSIKSGTPLYCEYTKYHITKEEKIVRQIELPEKIQDAKEYQEDTAI